MWTRALTSLTLLAALTGAPSAEARHPRLRKPARGFQMRMGEFTIPPGGEREVCEPRVTPNKQPIDVSGFDLRMPAGSHHFVLWEYLGNDTNPDHFPQGIVNSVGCIGVGPPGAFSVNGDLFGMQTARARLRFPRGIAVRLEANARVFLNAHIRNFSAIEPLTPEIVFNVRRARKGTVKHRAQNLIVGNSLDINIPAHSGASLTSDWFAPADLNVVQLSTHQHKRGTHTLVRHIDAGGNDLGQLFEANDWEHPGEKWFVRPTFRLRKGEGLRFTCEWNNPDDHVVRYGVTTNDEMCFVAGYFYPDDESVPVRGPGCIPQGAGILCFGRKVP